MSTINHVLGQQQQKTYSSSSSSSVLDADLEKKLYEALIHGSRASNSFPGENDDLGYFENIPEFQQRIAEFRDRLVKLILDMAANVDSSDELFNLAYLKNADPADIASFEPIANVIELLLENVDGYLDEAQDDATSSSKTKQKQRNSSSSNSNSQNQQVVVSKSDLVRDVRAGLHGVITHANNIDRPQLKFKSPVDNNRTPFRPRITTKPHAIVPLPEGGLRLVEPEANSNSNLFIQPRYPHPYQTEIQEALRNPPDWILQQRQLEPVLPLDQVPCTWVDTVEKLSTLCQELKGETEIAIDLENHSYRSFQGFVCLMQISTRQADYLIDTLALREHMYQLNEYFCDPRVVKVLHGADSDILWLQRDFGLYIVSLFDTGQAARVLEYPSAGLAHALNRHCHVRVNKAYQLADWRIRPLTDEMQKYAREDTHYLLFVFHKMRNELLQARGEEGVQTVLRNSAEIALTIYEKELFTPNSYKKLLTLKNIELSVIQNQVFSAVFGWRDAIARREDESTQYVLPDRMLIRIAQEMPVNASDLERCCNPLPPIVQTRVTEILALVRSARNSKSVDEDEDAEVLTLTKQQKEKPPLPPSHPGGSVQIGLNSSKTSFVPINPTMNKSVSFAEAAKGGLKGDRRGTLKRNEVNARATPSPVLTTEQLYDTAGWQDVADPDWKASVVARTHSGSNDTITSSPTIKPAKLMSENYRTAVATKNKIGEEMLHNKAAFGALNVVDECSDEMSTEECNSSQKGEVIDIDTPADADALESDDIPKSMAEIYRISNRNRKLNKDKKKQKDDGAAAAGAGGSSSSSSTTKANTRASVGSDEDNTSTAAIRKQRGKSEDMDVSTSGTSSMAAHVAGGQREGGDDAIDFMRNIGWVEGESKPVATLLVPGAPEEPPHLAGASAETCGNTDRGGSSNKQSAKAGNNQKMRRKMPQSPRRRPSNSNASNSSQHSKGSSGSGGNSKLYGYAQAAASGGGAGQSSSKPVQSGFSYSQAAASSRGGRQGGSSSQQQYRGKGGYGKSMPYSK